MRYISHANALFCNITAVHCLGKCSAVPFYSSLPYQTQRLVTIASLPDRASNAVHQHDLIQNWPPRTRPGVTDAGFERWSSWITFPTVQLPGAIANVVGLAFNVAGMRSCDNDR